MCGAISRLLTDKVAWYRCMKCETVLMQCSLLFTVKFNRSAVLTYLYIHAQVAVYQRVEWNDGYTYPYLRSHHSHTSQSADWSETNRHIHTSVPILTFDFLYKHIHTSFLMTVAFPLHACSVTHMRHPCVERPLSSMFISAGSVEWQPWYGAIILLHVHL